MQLFAFAGNVITASVMLTAEIVLSLIKFGTLTFVDLIDFVFGSGKATSRKKLPWHAQRYAIDPIHVANSSSGELDVPATLAKSEFPIKPAELILKAKAIIATEFGTAGGSDPRALLADDFQFVAPIVGPLPLDEFLRAFGSFKLKDAIPDIKDNAWFTVDPLEPNRVWWFSRVTGTHTGPLRFAGSIIKGEGKKVMMPPQASSFLFDAEGKAYTLTTGYTMDKRVGNSNGLGAVLGILYAIGRPIPVPEGQALYTPSIRFEALERMGKAVENLGFDPNTGKAIDK